MHQNSKVMFHINKNYFKLNVIKLNFEDVTFWLSWRHKFDHSWKTTMENNLRGNKQYSKF